MIGTIATDRSYQFLRVITRVGHTEGPQRDVSGLNADIAMKRGRERERKKVAQEDEEGDSSLPTRWKINANWIARRDLYGRSD